MEEKLADCEQCEIKGSLIRIPNNFIVLSRQQTPTNTKPGTIVETFIEETKKEIQIDKERLKREEYTK